MRESKIVLDLWWEFTTEELQQKGQDLARALELQGEMEIAEKGRREQYKTEMEEMGGQVRSISQHIRRRGMLRPVPCTVLFHRPRVGAKTVVREDTGELVKEEAMSPAECQEHLFPIAPDSEKEQAKSAGSDGG